MSATSRRADGLLLEREQELGALARLAAEAGEGRGGVALIEGPAGVGKSRLLGEALGRAEEAGLDSLRARGSELERNFSFGAALQLLGPPVLGAGEPTRRELFRGAAGHAEPLFRDARTALGDAAADQTFPLYHGLHWLLVSLSERSPLILAVDDAHWIDDQSSGFLVYLAQRLEELPLALVVAVRTGEPAAAGGLLERLGEAPGAEVLRPAPLSCTACERIVLDAIPAADESFARACSAASGGNPFVLRELVAAIESDGIAPTAGSAERVFTLTPEAVSRSVLARLGRLPGPARELARAAAVLGEGPLAEAAAIASVEPPAAAEAAALLERANVIAAGDRLRFVHPVLRSVVYEDAPAAWLVRAHARAAELARERGALAEVVAAHLLPAERGALRWAIEVLEEAARDARRQGAPATAARYLRRALEEEPERPVRGELLLALGGAEADAGEESGLERFEAARGLLADPARRIAALREIAGLLLYRGRYPDAAAAAGEGLAALRDAGARSANELATDLEAMWLIAKHWGVVVAERAESWEQVERLIGRERLEATPAGRGLLGHAGLGEAYAGRRRERAAELVRRAMSGGQPSEDPLDGIAFALGGFALIVADELLEAEAAMTAAIEAGRRRGSILEIAAFAHVRSIARYRLGWLAEAASDAEDAVEGGRHGWGATLPMAHAYVALIRLERGEEDAAWEALELPGGEELWRANPSWGAWVAVRGRLRLQRGEAEEGRADLAYVEAMAQASGALNPAMLPWRSWAAACAQRLGDETEARRLADEELELARAWGAPRAVAQALRGDALVAGGERAITALEEALELLEGSPAALEDAHVRFALGAALRRAGRRREARERLAQALDLAHRAGAGALVERALSELRVAGARPRRPAMSGVAALTPSERRVAALAAEGRSNREIAEGLFVTERTVEMHLTASYAKLGIASRRELPHALAAGEG
ncbi:MAG: AAA family ATPase [Thermoleophilaceae bacterium]